MANFTGLNVVDAGEISKYQPDTFNFGIASGDSKVTHFLSETNSDILRNLRAEWWPTYKMNVYTDITTVFDLSTAVTIGDAGDDNGFQEATDWTSGLGLTDATRGAYVTTFKTMRSVSGTTAIKAYNFTTSGSAPSKMHRL